MSTKNTKHETTQRKVNLNAEILCASGGKCEGICKEQHLEARGRICPGAYNPTNNRDRRVSTKRETNPDTFETISDAFKSRQEAQNRVFRKAYGRG